MNSVCGVIAGVLLTCATLATAAQPCRNGQLEPAPAPYAGSGSDLLQRVPALAAAHARLLGQPQWLSQWSGPSSEPRQFTAAGHTYLIADVCQPHACGDQQYFGVWDLDHGHYGGLRYKFDRWIELGVLDDGMRAAALCAIEADQANARQVREYLNGHPFQAPWE